MEDAKIERWLKDLAPSTELRKWFGHDLAKWDEFQRRYRRELETQHEQLAELAAESRRRTVTLVFAARDDEHCNAVVLKDVLAEIAADGK